MGEWKSTRYLPPTERPWCIGVAGWLLGHRYVDAYAMTPEERYPGYCLRCGLAAEVLSPAQYDGPGGGLGAGETIGAMSDSGWFARYESGGSIVTLWEFSLDGLTEEQAVELDRRIREMVEAFQAAQYDGTRSDRGENDA